MISITSGNSDDIKNLIMHRRKSNMSKVNNKVINEVKKCIIKQKSRRQMPTFILNNWRKMHHRPMQRRVHRRRARYSSCKMHK